MSKRRVFWLLIGLFVLAALAVLLPASPAYAPRLFVRYVHYHNGHSLGYWMKALDSPDPDLRKRAIFSVGQIGSPAHEAIPALTTILLEDADPEARGEAALALLKMIPASAEVVPALARALGDEEPAVRMYVAITLFRLGDKSQPAIAALVAEIKQPRNDLFLPQFTQSIQEMMILALGRAGSGSAEVAAELTEMLENAPTDRIRIVAIRALGDVGSPARTAVPHLRKLQTHDNKVVREMAAAALDKIDG